MQGLTRSIGPAILGGQQKLHAGGLRCLGMVVDPSALGGPENSFVSPRQWFSPVVEWA